MLTEDVTSILIEGKDGYEKVKKLSKNLTPSQSKKIKLFKSKDNSLFAENNIENQINDLFSLSVKLESGGSIVINTTEALVAIDVNSGKNTSERNIENTALKTNLEAANEIARQLRLRDLGGLVVVDFIDMDDYRNNFKVEKTIKTALHRDRARVQVGRISMFGLLELSRQRLRSSLIDKSFEKCNYCNGSGLILNTSSISEQIIKVIKEKLTNNENLNINVKCNTALAETLINQKKQEITSLENSYSSKINFIFDNLFSLHEPLVEAEKNSTEKKIIKKSKIKVNTIKKKLVRKKTKLTKKSIKKIHNENVKNSEAISDNKKIKKMDDTEDFEKVEEKTGWWS